MRTSGTKSSERDQNWKICRTAPDPGMIERMRHLPFPKSDPVTGTTGELLTAWHA
jgi:uncharacterized protein YjlB